MVIIWGRKLVYRRLGYVSDFCAVCRGIRPFELRLVSSARHIYYVSFSSGEPLHDERVCLECHSFFSANPEAYSAVSAERVPLEELRKLATPKAIETLDEQLATEHRIRSSPASLSPQERQAFIEEACAAVGRTVERRFAPGYISPGMIRAVLVALGLMVLIIIRPAFMSEDIAALLTIAAVVFVGGQWILSTALFMPRQILPVLATCLYSLRPSESEVRSVLATRLSGREITQRLNVGQLMRRMEKLAAADGRPRDR
jgi:hypothetical protein